MSDRIGINVIGHVRANLGVGVVTRQVIALFEERGHPVAAFDVDRGRRRESSDPRHDRLLVTDVDALPHRINVFVLGLGAVDWALGMCPDRFFDGRCVNAIVCFWELPVMPAARLAQLDGFDVVIAASDFMRHVYQQSLRRATVMQATLPVVLPEPLPFDRAALGIPASAVVFVFSFDPASDARRKNPLGVIEAFHRGIGNDGDAWLLVRVNNAHQTDGDTASLLSTLRAAAAGHRRIVISTQPLSYAEALGLYRACDVFVSLHRAEGLGLGMAEAMTMGMPVIATGWSGNMTFMRHSNACLVDYRMVPVEATLPAYTEENLVGEASWAEPDIAHAAALMARLASDADARAAIGRAAGDAMRTFNAMSRSHSLVDELLAIVEQRDALAARGYVGRRQTGRPTLRLPPVSLRRRIRATSSTFAARVVRKVSKWLHRWSERAPGHGEPPAP